MNRSDLIERLWAHSQLPRRDVDLAVNTMLKHMIETLAAGERIELREFGSFSLRYRAAQVGRNPKTGDPITVPEKYIAHFRPGKTLRKRVNGSSPHR
jgi:integration host factor subunit beta